MHPTHPTATPSEASEPNHPTHPTATPITIDPEFQALLPALDKETYARLEENLLQNGCRDALVVWGDILIDGHNRYSICTRHSIPFTTVSMDFDSREAALIWIISTQVARRNLTPLQLSHYRGLHYKADKKIQGTNNQYTVKSESRQNDDKQKVQRTVTRLSEQYRVSPKTIERDAKTAQAIDAIGDASPEAKRMILSGEVTINKKDLQELLTKSPEQIAQIAANIEGGTYDKDAAMLFSSPTPGPEGLTVPGLSAPSGPGSAPPTATAKARTQALGAALKTITADFQKDWYACAGSYNTAGMKAALRIHIDRLEDCYQTNANW
ncbi:MAG: hypothetical protein FWF91_07270 [Coriobacteriia bacterium]|nr:hypothetical protein [Coriobacteriia bacterium]